MALSVSAVSCKAHPGTKLGLATGKQAGEVEGEGDEKARMQRWWW